MEERKVILSNGKEVIVKEITFKDTFKPETRDRIDSIGYASTMLQLACGFTNEEIDSLSKKDGIALWKVYLELNEVENESFQIPQ